MLPARPAAAHAGRGPPHHAIGRHGRSGPNRAMRPRQTRGTIGVWEGRMLTR